MKRTVLFESCVYREELPQYVEKLDKICDPHMDKARKNLKKAIEEKKERWKVDVGDHGLSYHSDGNLDQEKGMQEFKTLILATSKNILESQGFDMSDCGMEYTEMWVQEFADRGGGHHYTHVHWDNHISGFYFLKCSNRTSEPRFHDPRPGRMMLNLPIKDPTKLCSGMERQSFSVKPGTLLMFNSYLPHEFKVDDGIDPFRFIHFNMKVVEQLNMMNRV
tara:strand:- start:21 stop:680 length:660 start_codon:yes stop_codon:yes gene_type:complete